jgi:hypothetical protein
MDIKKGETIKLRTTVVVEVMAEKDMTHEDLIDEFGSEAFYNFEDTDNLTVTQTEFKECQLT